MTADRDREPVPVGRYAILAVLAIAALLGIRSWSDRSSSAWPILATTRAIRSCPSRPPIRAQPLEIVLNDSHGFPGEVVRASASATRWWWRPCRVAAATPWSGREPTGDCALEISGDRLRDCDDATWTFEGVPFDPDGPSLIAFPAAVRNGAVIADFTAPYDPVAS